MLPYSILIADDDEKLLTVLRSYFEQDQCLVYTAQTGRQALDILKRYEPQLLVLDVMMPDMDGFEVCRHVRQTNDIPIIFLTARDDETDRLVGLNIGADDYVTKPFNVKELMACFVERGEKSYSSRHSLYGGIWSLIKKNSPSPATERLFRLLRQNLICWK